MFEHIWNFFKTGEAAAALPEAEAQSQFKLLRWRVFLSITIGYALYYIIRQSYAVIKKPLLASGVVTAEELGMIGAIFFITYGLGKFTNSFLSDRVNNKRFFSFGLLMSSVTMVGMGLVNSVWPLAVLWGLNGWFQSQGPGPSVVSLNQWFSNKQRGTLYGIWITSHNIGSALAYFFVAGIVSTYSWYMGFWAAGVFGIIGSIFIYMGMSDRPETRGLPNGAVFYGEKTKQEIAEEQKKDIRTMQWEVIKNPAVWIIGLSSMCCYISRYAIESWGVVYMTATKGYDIMGAAGIMAYMQMAGVVGGLLCGFISDKFFNHRRNVPALIYGICCSASLAAFLWMSQSLSLDMVCMTVYGFTMGSLVCYLGGLMAVDLVPKRVTGAAMGMIGLMSYAGAAAQEFITGKLMDVIVVDGANIYSFNYADEFWFSAAVASTLLALLVWNVKAED